MKLNQSIISEATMRYLQQNQDKKFTAVDIVLQADPNNDPTPETINLVKSFLNGMVRKDQLKKEYKSSMTSPDFYSLDNHQKSYWERKRWTL